MARDAELDRLKTAQNNAFQRKQNAHEAQQRAWEQRSSARETLNRAHEEKQRAYSAQDASWQDYQRVKSHNDSRIDSLDTQQENAYQEMKRAFDNASSAHDRRDGASARAYADEGHRHKAVAQGAVSERRRLVEENKAARATHEATKPAFQRAKDQFNGAKRDFDHAKSEHEKKQAEFKRAKADFDQAAKAFKDRLEKVRAESNRRKDDKRAIAEQAGVPFQYRDNVWISKDTDGNTNIYFGGVGKANGPGHGHYVLDRYGKVTYKRDPFDPHGGHNFERDPEVERKLAAVALEAFRRDRSSTGPRQVQYHDGPVTVKVRSGFHRDTGTIATDVIVIDRVNSPGEHLHLILSEHDGQVLFSEWRKDH